MKHSGFKDFFIAKESDFIKNKQQNRQLRLYWALRILLAKDALWFAKLFRTQLLVSMESLEFRVLFSQEKSWSPSASSPL